MQMSHRGEQIGARFLCVSLTDASAQVYSCGSPTRKSPLNLECKVKGSSGRLCCPTFIPVMESANLWKLHNHSEFWRLHTPRDRSIFIERQVCACSLVV